MDNNNLKEAEEARMRQRLQDLWTRSSGCLNSVLQMELISCDAEQQTCLFRAKTQSWMKNIAGTLHGGMGATILDHAMGAMLYCTKEGESFSPTVEMQASYHRPLIPEKDVLIKARIVAKSKRLAHMAAEVYQADDPKKVCVSGTSVYFITD